MPVNVFVSFDHEDEEQVNGFKALNTNPNHPLRYQDRSLKAPVVTTSGKPIVYEPDDPWAKPVRSAIVKMFNKASRMVVLIGESTHKSAWVRWEIVTFYEKKKNVSIDASRRIAAMRLKGCEHTLIPRVLRTRCSLIMDWDPRAFHKWLDTDLTI